MAEATHWGPRVEPKFRAQIQRLDDVDLVILERSTLLTHDEWIVVCGEMIGRRLPTPAKRGATSAVWDLIRLDAES